MLPFLAAAYYDHMKAFSQDSRSISVHVITRFLCQKQCALKSKAECDYRCHTCFLQVRPLVGFLIAWFAGPLLNPEALMHS